MKRTGRLFGQIATHENMAEAFWKAAKGKHLRPEVISFRKNFKAETHALISGLIAETLDLGDYHFFDIYDPKPRRICAASFRERVLHHAVMNVCEPVLERCAIFDSYACRKGRGSHKALERAQYYLGKNPWFLKLDIHKYFDSIDHDIALGLLSRKIKDKKLLGLFRSILATYHMSLGKGVPIGNLISQHLANFYLSGFDHWVKENLKLPYVRYMDDFIVFGQSRHELKKILDQVQSWLDVHLALHLHQNRQLNKSRYGAVYLGYRVYPWGIRLSSGTRSRLIRRCRQYEKSLAQHIMSEQELVCRIQALTAVTRTARAKGFRQTLFNRFKGVSKGHEPGDPRRCVQQPGRELPVRLPQLQPPVQPQPELGVPAGSAPSSALGRMPACRPG